MLPCAPRPRGNISVDSEKRRPLHLFHVSILCSSSLQLRPGVPAAQMKAMGAPAAKDLADEKTVREPHPCLGVSGPADPPGPIALPRAAQLLIGLPFPPNGRGPSLS